MTAMAATDRASDLSLSDKVILSLWNMKLNTHEIAKRMGRPEAQVANRLAALRDEGRA